MPLEKTNDVKLGRIAPMQPVSSMEASCRICREVFGVRKVFENGDPGGNRIDAGGIF